MVIDVHSHDFPDAIVTRAMSGMCRMTEGLLWPSGDGSLTNHLDHMERAGVDMAVTCPIATKPSQFDVIFRRACAIREGRLGERARRMLVPFASVHPDDPDVERHLRMIAAAGIKGIKFHPYYQDFSLVEERSIRMFGIIADLGLVVQCHGGGDISWKTLSGMCGPAEVEALMRKCPTLKFIAAHLGGCFRNLPHSVDRLLDLGVYIDTSVLHRRWFYDEEMRLLRSWPTERLLFATDFPWVHYPEAIAWVKSVRAQEDLPAVLGGNACRLLGL